MQPKTAVYRFPPPPISNCQFNPLPKKNSSYPDFLHIQCLVFPVNPDECSSAVQYSTDSTANQHIPHTLCNPKLYLLLSLSSILSQLSPFNTFLRHTSIWHILTLVYHLRLYFPNRLFPSGFTIETLYTCPFSAVSAPFPIHLLTDIIPNNIRL